MSAVEQSEVIRALVGLADSLVAGYDPLDLVQRLVDDCTRLLRVSAVGLLLADQTGKLQVAAASSEQMRVLELIQLQGEHGPCLEAYSLGQRVVAGGFTELQERWGSFATDMGSAHFRSVAAVPLRLRRRTLGALGLFSDREEVPVPEDVDIAQALADIATIALLQQQAVADSHAVSAQLQHALDSRVVIEQAKGVVAAQLGLTVGEAFALLRDHARTQHLPLRQVAVGITEGTLTGGSLRARGTAATAPPQR